MTDQSQAVNDGVPSEHTDIPTAARRRASKTKHPAARPPARDDIPNFDYLRSIIQRHLLLLAPTARTRPQRVHSAIRYSLLAPGKRIRPMLSMLTAYGAGRFDTAAMDAGCAVELVHTASLVLDDLPSMDDAEYRRGQLCAHRRFGESTAILSSIAMLNRAFGLLSSIEGVDYRTRNRLVTALAGVVGSAGLVAGQERDLNERNADLNLSEVDSLNRLKTGVLFVASVQFGGLVAGLDDEDLGRLQAFGELFGLAFQTADDIVDVQGALSTAGKDVKQDGAKPTVVALAGVDTARRRAGEQLQEAREVLADCSFDTAPLAALVADFERRSLR